MTVSYLLRRLVTAILVVIGVTLAVFIIARLTGDPAVLLVGPGASEEDIQAIRQEFHLDRPILEQYLLFASGALRGDFGRSLIQGQPAMNLVLERMPATLELTFAALLFSLVFAVPAGITAAVHRDSWIDRAVMLLSVIGQCLPVFWLGIMLILVFSVSLHLLPAAGADTPQHLILPAITLGAFNMARTARLVRSGMVEVLTSDYVRTARAKGLPELVVLLRHALRNSFLPILTVLGIEIGQMLSGTVVTEQIFAWPGMGNLALKSIFARDFPVVQAAVFLGATIVVLINLGVDFLYVLIDPRIKYR
ncbi:MAG: ABC transporter permease [Chloroflexi bacterium]|nr:ABC transporter permease [Chloroflexota bacterium]